MTQQEYLSKLLSDNQDAIIVSSLGNIKKDIMEIEHPHKVLLHGAMGHAIGCGLGIALSTKQKVIVVTGEGSLLMKLGSMATVLFHKLPNLEIKVLDNGCYNSCGGQGNYFSAIKKLIPFEVIRVS